MTDRTPLKLRSLRLAEKAVDTAARAAALASKQVERVTVELADAKERAMQARLQASMGSAGKRARWRRAARIVDDLLDRRCKALENREIARVELRCRQEALRKEAKRSSQQSGIVKRMPKGTTRS